MKLVDLISPEGVSFDITGHSKKQVLQELSQLAASTSGLDSDLIFEALNEREKLGCTGIGEGVAIPHARLEAADKCHLFFARLSRPVDFSADDDHDVDLVFCLIASHGAKEDPVAIMSKLRRMASNSDVNEQLRSTTSVSEVIDILSGCSTQMKKAA